jgi:two-component system chemotaxis sensor kinase CheA
MDVVKINIEQIGGTISLESTPKLGTTISIRFPLTLAIVPALIVSCAGTHYAIPKRNLLDLASSRQPSHIDHWPLLKLSEVMGQENTSSTTILLLQNQEHSFRLAVDTVLEPEDLVVKPLGWSPGPLFYGASIMGDGRIALILDCAGLAARLPERALIHSERLPIQEEPLLIAQAGARKVAFRLNQLKRVEEFSSKALQQQGQQLFTSYQGTLLPLYWPGKAPSTVPVRLLVLLVEGAGLIVDDILEVTEALLPQTKAGFILSGTNQHIELLDINQLVYSMEGA